MTHAAIFAAMLAVIGCADDAKRETAAAPRDADRADEMRATILSFASYAGFADSCTGADLRTFERDSLGLARRALTQLQLVVTTHGANAPLDNRRGRALVRAVLRLETGGPAPRWDTVSDTGPRVLNPHLPMRVRHSVSKECVLTEGKTPFGVVVPEIKNFEPPRDSGAAAYIVGYGPDGLKQMRDFFYTKHGQSDPNSIMHHVRITSHAMWGDYAIVSVERAADRQGAVPLTDQATGAVFAFHLVGDEWRLLGVVRDW